MELTYLDSEVSLTWEGCSIVSNHWTKICINSNRSKSLCKFMPLYFFSTVKVESSSIVMALSDASSSDKIQFTPTTSSSIERASDDTDNVLSNSWRMAFCVEENNHIKSVTVLCIQIWSIMTLLACWLLTIYFNQLSKRGQETGDTKKISQYKPCASWQHAQTGESRWWKS